MALFGMDVSTYNTSINYSAAKLAGIRFAMVKATQGHSLYNNYYLFEDSRFKYHVEGFYKTGIPIGAYHFFTASNAEDAIREADFFIKTVSKYRDKISLYLACDAENYQNKYISGLSREALSKLIDLFCKRVEEAGFKACHYTNTDHIANFIDLSLIDYPVWQAHYIKGNSLSKPTNAKNKLAIHQYTDKGKLPGVVGSYDLNFGYAPIARLIISAKTPLEDKTLDYIEAYDGGESLIIKLADKLAVRSLNPIRTPSLEKLMPLIRYHCGLTDEETAYLGDYKWAPELFSKLYNGMITA